MTQQPPTPPRPPDGARYADDRHRYRLDGRIATGGMGEVWRGTDTSLGRPVAVKLLKSEYADDPTFRSRFETEARHAAALHHSGVAAIYDVGEARGADAASGGDGSGMPRPFLVMELVDGQPLSALLRGGRAMDAVVVSDLLAQAGDAVGAAHRAGIVHRDLKPANLLVTPDRTVKITDFGIARATDGLGLTGTGQVMGTPQYLSPEQARGNPATPASDVYSLGVVAFECLVGHRPFEAESPVATALAHLNDPVPTLPASVPADLARVVRRALAKKPEERFADGAAFAAALRDPARAGAAGPIGVTGATGATQVVAPGEVPAERTQVLPSVPAGPLPPVHPAPPVDADPPAGDEPRSPWSVVVLLVAVLAVAAVIVVLLVNRNGNGSGTDQPSVSTTPSTSQTSASTSSSATESSPSTFSIEEGDYLGRNVDDVVADLRDRGLRPRVEERDNPGGEDADSVVSVDPTSDLETGDSVTVVYWGEAEPTPTPTPTPTPSPSQTPSPSPTPSPSQSSPSSGGSTSGATDSESPSASTSPVGA